MSSRFAIGSRLSTILSMKYKPSTIVLFSEHENPDFIKISSRNNSDPPPYSMNDMIRFSIKELEESTGGGHVAASGAVILRKDLETFKKRVLEFVGDKIKS